MPFVETFEEFKARQNCESLFIKGRHLYRNGAQVTDMGYSDPPRDEFARLKLQREFLQHKQDEQEKRFTEIQQEAMDAAANYLKYGGSTPPPNSQAPHALKLIRGVVQKCREEIAAIDVRLNVKPENEYLRNQQRLREERNSEVLTLLNQIKEITI